MRPIGIGLGLLCLLLALPVISLASAWLALDAAAMDVLRHQWETVLPDYTRGSLVLAVAVGIGVAMVGTGAAVAVTLFDFPGRRLFELTLLLPLAMPAYVLAYAWTDALQFSGPLQTALRAATATRSRRTASFSTRRSSIVCSSSARKQLTPTIFCTPAAFSCRL